MMLNLLANRSGDGELRFLFFLVCFVIPIGFSIFFHWKYLTSKIRLISIQFAGGEIAFNANWFSKKEMDDFQKQLRIAKDLAKESSEKAMANTIQAAMQGMAKDYSSSAADLVKYAELFEKGLISREEFEQLKNKLL